MTPLKQLLLLIIRFETYRLVNKDNAFFYIFFIFFFIFFGMMR